MGRRYPPIGERTRAIAAIAALNTFSAAQVEGSKSAAPLGDKDCCSVTHLPRRPQGRTNNARLYFGMDDDGYVYVTARSRAAQRVWPAAKNGLPLPVRLARWMLNAGSKQVARHICDNPQLHSALSHHTRHRQQQCQRLVEQNPAHRRSSPLPACHASDIACPAAATTATPVPGERYALLRGWVPLAGKAGA